MTARATKRVDILGVLTRLRGIVFCLALAGAALVSLGARAESLRVATTTSFVASGLAEVLIPEIARALGLEVQLVIVGSGQALRLGAAGDVDAVLSHDQKAALLAEGHFSRRVPVMRQDFVLLGPAHDPAGVRSAASAVEALARIARARAPFVSRGDDSGTHKAEQALWRAAGVEPRGPWYRPIGAGMGAALNTAAAMGAYVLSDRASWLAFRNRQGLTLVFEDPQDPMLQTLYAFLVVNPDKGPHLRTSAAERLADWLTGPEARALISEFTIDSGPAFRLP